MHDQPMTTHPTSAGRRYFIGIDDTDNLESRGTGFRVRQLGGLLAEQGLAEVEGITRHQLLVDPAIPYTSHNSAACLGVRLTGGSVEAVTQLCSDYLLAESAPGSDAGLCILPEEGADAPLRAYGRRAQQEILNQEIARTLAGQCGAFLAGLTGDHGGIIGALAAVGLRAAGNDGRFLWVRGIREAGDARMSIEQLYRTTGVDGVRSPDGTRIETPDERVDLGSWPRPVLLGGQAVLLVEENNHDENCRWRVVPKDVIKRY